MHDLINKLEAWEATSELFKMLSSETRVAMVMALQDGPLSVGALADRLGLNQAVVSHQLKSMRYLNIVCAKRQGRCVIYMLKNPDLIELIKTAQKLVEI